MSLLTAAMCISRDTLSFLAVEVEAKVVGREADDVTRERAKVVSERRHMLNPSYSSSWSMSMVTWHATLLKTSVSHGKPSFAEKSLL
jgi:hypothetical protein